MTRPHSLCNWRYGPSAVNEMLSTAACLRGLSLIQEFRGDIDTYRMGLKVLLSSVGYYFNNVLAYTGIGKCLRLRFYLTASSHVHSFAEKAESQALCVTAAGYYWNACLALTQCPEERFQLKEHLEILLNALVHTTKHETVRSCICTFTLNRINYYCVSK